MFLLDTQQQLQSYFDIIGQLNSRAWVADIQSIYRAIHTIKGGAVTVEADGMLHAAMILEQLLSDLRYLEVSPPLDDGQLRQILLEAGELLASCLEVTQLGSGAIDRVQLTLQRLEILHAQVREGYLGEWSEMKQVHQEFAEQGFDLVVLEFEMAVNQLPEIGLIPSTYMQVGVSMLEQLRQIGADLEFASGWMTLIDRYQTIIDRGDCQQWRSSCSEYLALLKQCAKNSGEIPPELPELPIFQDADSANELELPDRIGSDLWSQVEDAPTIPDVYSDEPFDPLDLDFDRPLEMEFAVEACASSYDDRSLLAEDLLIDELLVSGDEAPAPNALTDEIAVDELLASGDLEIDDALEPQFLDLALQDIFDRSELSGDLEVAPAEPIEDRSSQIEEFLDDFLSDFDLETYHNDLETTPELEMPDPVVLPAIPSIPEIPTEDTSESITEIRRNIQIPVPLIRLDRSAQQVVDALLTTRGVNSQAQTLQIQLAQLSGLTAESSQFASKLRQLQDDYSLLRNLSDERESGNNLSLERYRQGYTTINRLLESMLRMSELGQEIEISTHQTFTRLADLDRQILRLKDGIKVSRLVPFRNLTMRARAILRDLTNRYGKPVDLVVNNEQIELDAGVVQQLEPALLHLLRNAYDHGVEPVEARLANGKAAIAKVTISLQRQGTIYRLSVQDDGGGIDRAKIATQAQTRGFAKTNTSTNADLLAVLCQPGFSSADVVTEVSGRGVGMDVVANQIAAIGGKLRLDTDLGAGTMFTIEVPAPQLLISCVLLMVGDRTVALPTADILETILLDRNECQFLADRSRWQITTDRGISPGFSLATYWHQFSDSLPENAIGLRCRLEDNSNIWLIADDLISQSDLSINPLPSPLIPPPGLIGVSLQPDGRLISVLDPVTLTDVLKSRSGNPNPTLSLAIAHPATTTILVVDDAALMRRRLSASLTTAGFVVHTCEDGLEALKWLQTNELPSLMITDMEMPNMDGLTLIDRCRQTAIDIPILIVSSRLWEDWGKEAQRVGANGYLNKGFTTEQLLATVSGLLARPVGVGGRG